MREHTPYSPRCDGGRIVVLQWSRLAEGAPRSGHVGRGRRAEWPAVGVVSCPATVPDMSPPGRPGPRIRSAWPSRGARTRLHYSSHMPALPDRPCGLLQAFVSYAHADSRYATEMLTHLAPLADLYSLDFWIDRNLVPGESWGRLIDLSLGTSDLFVPLLSPDYFASAACLAELHRATAVAAAGQFVVIPILVRPCGWMDSPIAALQLLPGGAVPVARWPDRDDAWASVYDGISRLLARVPLIHEGSLGLEVTSSGATLLIRMPQATSVLVGRVSHDVRLRLDGADVGISRRHCALRINAGQLAVEDFGSKNGTRVNGALVTSHPLCPGDVVSVGASRFTIRTLCTPRSQPSVSTNTDPPKSG